MGHDLPPLPLRDVHTVRWYVLSLPACHKGPAKGLEKELDRRVRLGEPTFDFFAPSFVEMHRREGRLVETHRPLLYSDELPVYVPEAGYLRKGDRIRITDGRFKGVEASVVIQPGVGEREVMVCVDNWMWVPLLRVQPGEYEVISLAEEGKHVYTRLDNSRIQNGLHEALGRHWGSCGVTAADRELAAETLRTYGELQLDSAVMRCKLYSLLLPAYTILGDEERQKSLIGTIVSFLSLIRAEQSLALLLLTLYGCTDSSIYYYRAHELIDPWSRESSPKKSKLSLIRRLADYDRWLKHNE